jgi:DoxX-like protein
MDTSTEPPTITSHHRSMRWRAVGYWLATVLVVAELGVGGIWDIARIPYVRDLVAHLGYPSYFLVLLGKLEGAGRTRSAGAASRVAQGMGLCGRVLHLGAVAVAALTGPLHLGRGPLEAGAWRRGSGAPPVCWLRWSGTAGRSCTTWPSRGVRPTSIIW